MSVDLPSSTEPQVSTRNVGSAETRSRAFMPDIRLHWLRLVRRRPTPCGGARPLLPRGEGVGRSPTDEGCNRLRPPRRRLDRIRSLLKGERRFALHPHPSRLRRDTFSPREKGGDGGLESLWRSSEVPLALLLFHRGRFVRVDQASLPLGRGGLAHFCDDVAER